MFILMIVILLLLVATSSFFSGSETSMMALNRYRLRHLAEAGHTNARRAQSLLRRPDRLLGCILIGNTIATIVASSITTILASEHFGNVGVAVSTVTLTLIILIFGEVMPKTVAAVYPEQLAFPASLPLKILLKIMHPLVWVLNGITHLILKPLGIIVSSHKIDSLSADELRSVLTESGDKITRRYRSMLLGVLDLEKATVADVMVPRHKIIALDLNEDWKNILQQLRKSPYSRLPVYRESLDNVLGILHLRKLSLLLESAELNVDKLEPLLDSAYFIPESTSLQRQLLNFQKNAEDLALVVDEYGDIQGLATAADILEEIVGDFLTDQPTAKRDIAKQNDGSYIVHASIPIRDINRLLHLELPISAKTLGGLITEHLEDIPTRKTSLLIDGYPIEIIDVQGNAVTRARISPRIEHRSLAYPEH